MHMCRPHFEDWDSFYESDLRRAKAGQVAMYILDTKVPSG